MTKTLEFTLNCVPTPQARVRHTVRAGHSIAYKDKKQVAQERTLEAFLFPHVPVEPLEGVVAIKITAHMETPKSTPKKKIEAIKSGVKHYHTKKPDVDNCVKNILDAMSRMQFWRDDKQIAVLSCEKLYSTRPRWEIVVSETDDLTL